MHEIMKKLILALALCLVAAAIANAQDTTAVQRDSTDQYSGDNDQSANEEELVFTEDDLISIAELPHNVRAQLQNTSYAGWKIEKAYRKKKADKTIYAVELLEGNEVRIVKFDPWGNLIPEKDK